MPVPKYEPFLCSIVPPSAPLPVHCDSRDHSSKGHFLGRYMLGGEREYERYTVSSWNFNVRNEKRKFSVDMD